MASAPSDLVAAPSIVTPRARPAHPGRARRRGLSPRAWRTAAGHPTWPAAASGCGPPWSCCRRPRRGRAEPSAASPARWRSSWSTTSRCIHDDIIDGDRERRHRPTVWAEFGIGAGHHRRRRPAALALQVLLEDATPRARGAARAWPRRHPGDDRRPGRRHGLRDAGVGHRGGVPAHGRGQDRGPAGLRLPHRRGILAGAARRRPSAPCRLRRAPRARLPGHRRPARHLGRARGTGKPVGSDLRAHKKSLPVVTALAAARDGAPSCARCSSPRRADRGRLARAADLADRGGRQDWAEAEADAQLRRGRRQPRAGIDLPAGVRGRADRRIADFVTARADGSPQRWSGADGSTPVETRRAVPEDAPFREPPATTLLGLQHAEGWWKGELETNVTMDAEDLLLRQFLGILDERGDRGDRDAGSARSQRADGTWATYYGGPRRPLDHRRGLRRPPPGRRRARRAAHGAGRRLDPRARAASRQTRVFTRIWLALFGLWSWDELPVLPPELILLPPRVAAQRLRLRLLGPPDDRRALRGSRPPPRRGPSRFGIDELRRRPAAAPALAPRADDGWAGVRPLRPRAACTSDGRTLSTGPPPQPSRRRAAAGRPSAVDRRPPGDGRLLGRHPAAVGVLDSSPCTRSATRSTIRC